MWLAGGRIGHFGGDRRCFGSAVSKWTREIGFGSTCRGADFAAALSPLCDRVCVNACYDLC